MSHELRRRIAVTLGLVAAAQALRWIPVPGVSARALLGLTATAPEVHLAHLLGGRASIGALGVVPYISGSALAALLHLLRRRGDPARDATAVLERHALWLAFAIALIQGFAYGTYFENLGARTGAPVVPSTGPGFLAIAALSIAAGAMLVAAFARLITQHGLGNGLCVLLGVDLLRGQAGPILDGWRRGDSALHDNAPALALVVVAFLMLTVLWHSARWKATEPDGTPDRAAPAPWWLRANVAGVAGLGVADAILTYPVMISAFFQRGAEPPRWISALGHEHLVGALFFVAISAFVTWVFSAWALDPGRLTRARVAAGETAADAAFDEARYDRRAFEATFWLVVFAPLVVLLFGLVVHRMGATGLGGVGLAIVAAVALDTLLHVRAHAAMARALGAPGGREACGSCGGLMAGGEPFCPSCGAAFEGAPSCPTHPDAPALACCVVCERPLCDDCARRGDGRFVCADHTGIAFVEGWAVVSAVETPIEAEGLRRRLAVAGIGGQVLASTCSAMSGTLGLYDLTPVVPLLAHSMCGGGSARLLVRPGDHVWATEIVAAAG
jgi:preprotein translocase subunit SecY